MEISFQFRHKYILLFTILYLGKFYINILIFTSEISFLVDEVDIVARGIITVDVTNARVVCGVPGGVCQRFASEHMVAQCGAALAAVLGFVCHGHGKSVLWLELVKLHGRGPLRTVAPGPRSWSRALALDIVYIWPQVGWFE